MTTSDNNNVTSLVINSFLAVTLPQYFATIKRSSFDDSLEVCANRNTVAEISATHAAITNKIFGSEASKERVVGLKKGLSMLLAISFSAIRS